MVTCGKPVVDPFEPYRGSLEQLMCDEQCDEHCAMVVHVGGCRCVDLDTTA